MTVTITKVSRVHRKLDWHLRRNEKVYAESLRKWFAFTTKQIQSDLTSKFSKDITSELTDWKLIESQGIKELKPATLKIMQDGGDVAYDVLKVSGSYDILNVEAVKSVEKLTTKMVKDVTKGTKAGIRTFIRAGIKEGKSMPKIAREMRPIIGLTKLQTESVINFKARLQDKEKYPGLSAADIDKRTNRYAAKTHRRRTNTIARTETATAQSEGYLSGLDDLDVKQVEFSSFPDEHRSTSCAVLEGDKFDIADASGIIPVHPNCRCAWLPVRE